MDSLILALEEHKSKSKPWAVRAITRIIHLREREGERQREAGRVRRDSLRVSHCFSFCALLLSFFQSHAHGCRA